MNERVDMKKYIEKKYVQEAGFLGEKHAHIFGLTSRGENYGFLVYITDSTRLSGYIKRITTDIIPNCIRIIEENWKK